MDNDEYIRMQAAQLEDLEVVEDPETGDFVFTRGGMPTAPGMEKEAVAPEKEAVAPETEVTPQPVADNSPPEQSLTDMDLSIDEQIKNAPRAIPVDEVTLKPIPDTWNPDNAKQPEVDYRRKLEEEGFSAFKPVEAPYSGTIDQIKYAESDIKAKYAQKVSAIISNVPKRLQQRYLAREQANFNEVAQYLEMKRSHIGGEMYNSLTDDARVVADQLRQRGVPGIQASKLASKSEQIKRNANDMLSEFANDPATYNALKNRLYGREIKDEVTGAVRRENGIIQQNNYGVLDTVNDEEFDNLFKDVEAKRAYRRSVSGMNRAAGSSRSGGSSKSPETYEMDQISKEITMLDKRLGDLTEDADAPEEANIKEERDALWEQYRKLMNRRRQGDNQALQDLDMDTLPGDGALRSTIEKVGMRKADQKVETIAAAAAKVSKDAYVNENDANGRKKEIAGLEALAKKEGIKIVREKTEEDLIAKLAKLGDEPRLLILEGKVGAGTGLNGAVMNRGSFQAWAKKNADPELEKTKKVEYARATNMVGQITSKIRRLMPAAVAGASWDGWGKAGRAAYSLVGLKFDEDGRIFGATGDAKDVMAANPMAFENYNRAVDIMVNTKRDLDRVAAIKQAVSQ